MRLLEEYSVGQTLGEGAFGVVSVCKKRATGEEFAVKMVDKVETPVEQIKKEADMLASMDHPNIVKFHGVFYERCFVCIVMDKLSGGDLVEGLQRHIKEHEKPVNCFDTVHVSHQMGASLQYLHNRNVVHRDIKGDNFLMDRKDMTDPLCRIVLTDFGTACNAGPEDRLRDGVGTKIFWPPEFFDRSYGHKVDVWAMGVIMYGLVSGRFPFRDENDIRMKEVKSPKGVHATCQDFVKKMLDKSEKTRLSANKVMQHPWLVDNMKGKPGNSTENVATTPGAKEEEDPGTQDMREDDVNDGIKERRQELKTRLIKENEMLTNEDAVAQPRKEQNFLNNKHFMLADKQVPGGKVVYEWWDSSKVKSNGLLEMESQASPVSPDADRLDLPTFSRMLQDHSVDIATFGVGKAKTLEAFAKETVGGAARLMLDATKHKTLVRVVDVVLLKLRPKNGGEMMLVEVEERFPDGRKRETNRLPGTKKEPYENMTQTAERILKEMLNISPDMVELAVNDVTRHEEEQESPSYPGVRTVYRKEILEGVVFSTDAAKMTEVGLPSFAQWTSLDSLGNTKYMNWMTKKQAEARKVKVKANKAEAISTLVRPPIGMNEENLTKFLMDNRHDISKWGAEGAKTLKEFSTELIRGESTLTQGAKGELMRVVDVVVLIVQNHETGETLLQAQQIDPDGKTHNLNRLPGAKHRPDENQFLSARRVLRRQMEIDENVVKLEQQVLIVEEDRSSTLYPGLKTVYRKRLIKGKLVTKTR